jgi:hypothetical protein
VAPLPAHGGERKRSEGRAQCTEEEEVGGPVGWGRVPGGGAGGSVRAAGNDPVRWRKRRGVWSGGLRMEERGGRVDRA